MSSFHAVNPRELRASVLEHIVSRRRTHLAQIRAELNGVQARDLVPSSRSLYLALGAGQRALPRYVMECKAASPSLGLIRDPYQPVEIARIYGRYASAISVLCEPEFFGGSYDHLASVSATTQLPVLCKDFIIDPIQVIAARYYGADAILLMLSILDDTQYQELAELAAKLRLDVLTEVNSAHERERALRLGAKIIGINNRDLRDLSIDLERTPALAAGIPNDVVVLSESGIRTNRDVRKLASYVSGFLVGSGLTSKPDIDFACRELVYGNVKVCGLTSVSQAQMAAAMGACYGGLILADGSPRQIKIAEAARIATAVPQLRFVAVTTLRDAQAISDQLQPLAGLLHAVQIHGNVLVDAQGAPDLTGEAARILTLKKIFPEIEIWRGLDANNPQDLAAVDALSQHARIVLDSGSGGSGRSFSWTLIPNATRQQIVLAGGIGKTNMRSALAQQTWGIDLNSQVEYPVLTPGTKRRKDPTRLAEVLQQARSYCDPVEPREISATAIETKANN